MCRNYDAQADEAIDKLLGDVVFPTHTKISVAFGVSINTVRSVWVENGMPNQRGAYRLADIAKWIRRSRDEMRSRLAKSPLKDEKDKADLVKAQAQARIAEAKAARESGNLVEVDEVNRRLARSIVVIREQFLMIPAAGRPMLCNNCRAEFTAWLDEKLRGTLEGLASMSQAELDELCQA